VFRTSSAPLVEDLASDAALELTADQTQVLVREDVVDRQLEAARDVGGSVPGIVLENVFGHVLTS
jgi:hypothetical protein